VWNFWQTTRDIAGLKGVRLHDLRHTFASVLASSGTSLQVIGALIGHSHITTTARYAHLVDDSLREATNRAGRIIAGDAP
jgi:site-specific recombinase XerD